MGYIRRRKIEKIELTVELLFMSSHYCRHNHLKQAGISSNSMCPSPASPQTFNVMFILHFPEANTTLSAIP